MEEPEPPPHFALTAFLYFPDQLLLPFDGAELYQSITPRTLKYQRCCDFSNT
jgi:hypothetical protein